MIGAILRPKIFNADLTVVIGTLSQASKNSYIYMCEMFFLEFL